MKQVRNIFYIAAVVLGFAFSAVAEDLTFYHKDLAAESELPSIAKKSQERFEMLKKSIERSRKQFKEEKLPSLVRERMVKRFEICDKLIRTIAAQSKNPQLNNVFHVVRSVNDLEIFDEYFREELALGKQILSQPKPRVFSVKDFGAKGNGVADDTAAVERALAAIRRLKGAPAELVFPKGKYRFAKLMNADSTRNLFGKKPLRCANVDKKHSNNQYYTKNIHFLLTDFDNLTVRGETPDTELHFARPEIGFLIAACYNVTIKDLTLRSTLETHTQGLLEAVDMKNKTLTIRIDKGYPLPDDPCWKLVRDCTCQSYDEKGVLVKAASDILAIKPWTCKKVGDRLYEMKYTTARYRQIPTGVRIAYPVRQDRQSMFMQKRCKFVVAQNLTIRNAGASAMPAKESYSPTFINCRILPDEGKIMSSAADGSINSDNIFGLYFRNCIFRNFGDDGINVFGYAGHVLEQKDNWIKADCHHYFDGEDIAPGETLKLKKPLTAMIIDSSTGKVKAFARVVSVKSTPDHGLPVCEMQLDGWIAKNDIITAKTLAPNLSWIEYRKYVQTEAARLRAQMKGGTTFTKPDMIAFPSESGIGTVISDCEFSNNRHNGITMQTSNVLIENNLIANNTDFGILIANYYRGLGGWREGGLPYNIVIRNNTIRNTFIALSLWYSVGIGKYAPVAAFRDIVFENNRCEGAVRGVDFYNVNGFCMRRNIFEGLQSIRSDKARNIYLENNLWNGETLSYAHFKPVAPKLPPCVIKTTDPKFKGRDAKIKLDYYRWSRTPDCVKLSVKPGKLFAAIVKEPENKEKLHPAFTQAGFITAGLSAGVHTITGRIVADRDCRIKVVSEIPRKKVFLEKGIECKANVPQPFSFEVNIGEAFAGEAMRVLTFFLAEAPLGTGFEIDFPEITSGGGK